MAAGNETELERLVVRLVGDGQEYVKMLQQAQADTRTSNAEITKLNQEMASAKSASMREMSDDTARGEQVTRQFESAEMTLARQEQELIYLHERGAISQETFTKAMEQADHAAEHHAHTLGELTGHILHAAEAYVGFETLHGFFEKAAEREVAAVKLNATLEANSRDVRTLTKDYAAFAKEQAEVSLNSVGEVKALLMKAETYGLTAEKAKEATEQAVAIAGATGGEASSIMRVTTALAQGNIERAMASARVVEQLRHVKDEAEFREKYNKLVEQGEAENLALTKTAEGQLHHLSTAWNALKGDMGKWIVEAAKPAIEATLNLVKWLRELPDSLKLAADVAIGSIAAYAGYAAAVALLGPAFATAKAASLAFIASPAGIAIAAYAAMLAAVAVLAKYIGDARREQSGLNEALAEGAKLHEKQVDVVSRASKGAVGRIEAGGTREQQQVLGAKELADAEKNLGGYKGAVASAQRNVEALGGVWDRMFNQPLIEQVNKELEEAKDRLNKAKEGVEALKVKMKELSDEAAIKKFNDAVKESIAKLDEEAATAGMNAEQKERYKLETMDATGSLKAFDEAVENKQAAEAAAELAKAIQEATDKAEEQIATFGMSASEIELYKLGLKGATEEQLAAIRGLDDKLEAMEKEKKMYTEANELMEKYRSSAEKLADKQDELKEMFEAGAIDAETYEKALADLTKQTKELSGAQAVASGSAEALSRMSAFSETINAQIRGGDGASAKGGGAAAKADPAQLQILKDIHKAIEEGNKKPGIEVESADLGGGY